MARLKRQPPSRVPRSWPPQSTTRWNGSQPITASGSGISAAERLAPLRAITEVVLRDIEGKPPSPEAAVAHRLAGTTEWYLGNFELARAHLEQTLAMFDPQRDRHLAYRFGRDTGVSAMVFMALTLWPLGETDQARRIGEEALARAVASGHMLTTVYGHFQCALLHVARRDAATTAPLAEAVVKLAREHGMALYSAYGEFLQPWARWHLGDREGGLDAMRRGIAACHDIGNLVYTTLFETALAETEAEAGEIEAALASIDRTVALTERTGQRWNEADTHRVRGEILFKRDPANTGPAENAFLTAIAVAQQQKAKSFELRAALSLAKLYQSDRPCRRRPRRARAGARRLFADAGISTRSKKRKRSSPCSRKPMK